jgi:hypothetical protein
MGTEAVAHDKEQALQAALFGLGGVGKGLIVLLVVTTTAILAGGEILLLHEGGRLGFKQGDSIGQDGGGAHSAENW